MSFGDSLDYLTLGNPISQAVISTTSALIKGIGLKPKAQVDTVTIASQHMKKSLADIAGRDYNFIRIAGISGASAVIMGVYCKYNLKCIEDHKEQLEAQSLADVANRIHFLHSFALMAIPLAHYPLMTGSFMVVGTLLFSGSMYYRALTGDKIFKHVTTGGGFCLIAAWLSLIF